MKKNVWMFAACLLTAGAAWVAVPAQAQVSIGVQIGPTMPPPPPQYEAVPVMPSGYVWAPGYWQWQEGRYMWRPGYRVHERQGYAYRAPRWEQGPNGWMMREGGWDRRDWDRRGDDDGRGRWHCPPGHAKKGEC
ncbi:YXWGXW repeat-containing protein [Ralstonia pseudosolanacearum]|uniref:YXWGXW repeat-containing protein n=1 Tax=Ralstonia pseudosolanacearum TaxID=1310165 RepID=UPI0026767746|nr:YXWGXW repeat-containing protein [Ralstonia pseudosolanacearum]MDO3561207.1 YXWGXW repeat-containing protein [Ralstonia pseudosolanacearum]MDO3570420.1 YXWGXW repeat-containing protein [Ralstonia pseudosolanacearum]MDO3614307.1 YXWGXW repeat-containing protein [Ralstonia pseudosolanacearum]